MTKNLYKKIKGIKIEMVYADGSTTVVGVTKPDKIKELLKDSEFLKVMADGVGFSIDVK